jgi:exosortase/archaeosortase family protein
VSWGRVLRALILSVVVIFLTNQVRLGVIALGSHALGFDVGYELTHRLIGSVLSIIGFSVAYLVFVVVIADLHLFRRQQTRRYARRQRA